MNDDDLLFTVTDLKQYTYCPRVVFYEQCLPHVRPRTYKMDAGKEAHETEQKRAVRRGFSKYEVTHGERIFDVSFTVPELHLTGTLDEIVHTDDGALIPVDYKLAKRVGKNHRIQLTAYALLIEHSEGCHISHGFVHLIPLREAVKVNITESLRQEVSDMLEQMKIMVTSESFPDPTPNIRHCLGCEFRRFCNDI